MKLRLELPPSFPCFSSDRRLLGYQLNGSGVTSCLRRQRASEHKDDQGAITAGNRAARYSGRERNAIKCLYPLVFMSCGPKKLI